MGPQRQASPQNPNFAVTEAVARRLGPLLSEFVFVGGCATGLLITDPASAPVRVTKDVDVIAELATSYAAYADLGDRLRALGFGEDSTEGAPICRWTAGDLRLDVMPATGGALGFTNRWYVDALAGPQACQLAPDLQIRLVTGPLFLATKFEAFLSRGRGDYYTSHDLEDIISVVDGRVELPGEVQAASHAVHAYLSARFTALLDDDDFLSSLAGNSQATKSANNASALCCPGSAPSPLLLHSVPAGKHEVLVEIDRWRFWRWSAISLAAATAPWLGWRPDRAGCSTTVAAGDRIAQAIC